MSLNKNRLLVILGPTATGKTDLALKLAYKFQGELISADSRQVYTGLDIGTGKMTGSFTNIKKETGKWVVNEIPIHLYDVANPKRQYNVAYFVKDADKIIKDIHKRGKLPILVGGTGLYLKALLEGLPNLAIPFDKKLRKQLEQLSVGQLQSKLRQLSLSKWESLNNSDSQNPRRLVRAIELSVNPERKIARLDESAKRATSLVSLASRNDILKIGLNAPREILYQRVDTGVISRIKQGMIRESEILNKRGISIKRMKQLGLEYGVLADYLSGQITSQDQLVKILQSKIHGYVRRQITWFKNPSTRFAGASARRTGSESICWFDITGKDFLSKVENAVSKWYYSS